MLAVDYVVRFAGRLARPVAINLSFGNNYGSHDGQTLLETYIDQAVSSTIGNICIGTGNEGDTGKHTQAQVRAGLQMRIPMSVAQAQQGFSVQVWKNYVDSIKVAVETPDGRVIGPFDSRLGARRYELAGVLLDVYYDFPKPYQKAQIIYIDFVPTNQSVPSGEWKIHLTGETVVDGRVDLWLPVSGATARDTRFLLPDVDTSLTIPSTSSMAISVGAYNSQNDSYAAFSGRGYTRTNAVKPDLAAPGVDVTSCAPGGGYTVKSGTSIATPFVTGAVALMLEWGVVRGFDAYLYGEKAKAFLQRGARELSGYQSFPNPQVGYGALCLRDSIPF
jgi:subtilisin family serine protease